MKGLTIKPKFLRRKPLGEKRNQFLNGQNTPAGPDSQTNLKKNRRKTTTTKKRCMSVSTQRVVQQTRKSIEVLSIFQCVRKAPFEKRECVFHCFQQKTAAVQLFLDYRLSVHNVYIPLFSIMSISRRKQKRKAKKKQASKQSHSVCISIQTTQLRSTRR